MKVLLVNPPYPGDFHVSPPLGLGYVGAAVLASGHEVKILDYAIENPKFGDILKSYKPDWVGITGITSQYPGMKTLAQEAKKFGCKVVFGGIHVSAITEYVVKDCVWVDYVIKGEGEIAFPKLLGGLAGPGVFFYSDTRVIGQEPEAIMDLDNLNFPWSVLDPDKYTESKVHGLSTRRGPTMSVISSRGCPYSCTFCGASQVHGKKLRLRSVDNFLAELDYLKSKGIREIQILDDNFTFNQENVQSICQGMLNRGLGLVWTLPNGIRADRVTPNTLKIMKKAGCYYFGLGIESGSPKILKSINKSLNLDQVRSTTKLARDMGFLVQGFFMVGFPDETPEDLALTQKFALELPIDRISINPVIPMPGTKLYSNFLFSGLLQQSTIDWTKFTRLEYWSSPKLVKFSQRLNSRFYFSPVRIFRLLCKTKSWSEVKGLVSGFTTLLKSLRNR